MKAEPFRLPDLAMGEDTLAFWNAAMTYAEQPLPVGETGLVATFLEVRPPRPRPAFALHFRHRVRALVQFLEFPFEQMFGVKLSCEDVARMPPTVRAALDQGMLDTLRARLPPAFTERITDIEPLRDHRLPDGVDRVLLSWLHVDLSGPDTPPIAFCLGFPPRELPALLGQSDLAPSGAGRLALAVPSRLRVLLGTACLAMSELRALAPGDLVVLGEELDGTVLYVTAGPRCFVFSAKDGDWTCRDVCQWPVRQRPAEDGLQMEAEEPPEETPTEPEPPAAMDVPVTLEFDIGEMTVPFSEIEEWRPGSIVAIDMPRASEGVEVRIRANGRRIAIGDLVRLGDRLAVRIHSLSHGAAPLRTEPVEEATDADDD